MYDLPRQLTARELARLFEGRSRFVERLATLANPLDQARRVARELSDAEKREVLNAHPAIGASTLSARSALEQGGDEDPAVIAELERLNRDYEARFGFRFVVFVAGRSKAEIVPVLHRRLERSREEELETALDELVSIAQDRWRHP
ncbi:MAG: 2-oxo-4-hydroxy-4-carboxy-5-ureidoimidazoline decarboxylase [Gaiellaceae bacterium]